MRSKYSYTISALISVLILLATVSGAQQIRFPDFSSVANVQLNGSTHQATWQTAQVLRLTDGPSAPIRQ